MMYILLIFVSHAPILQIISKHFQTDRIDCGSDDHEYHGRKLQSVVTGEQREQRYFVLENASHYQANIYSKHLPVERGGVIPSLDAETMKQRGE